MTTQNQGQPNEVQQKREWKIRDELDGVEIRV